MVTSVPGIIVHVDLVVFLGDSCASHAFILNRVIRGGSADYPIDTPTVVC